MGKEKRGLSGFALKLIAAGAMLCSHIYKCLLVSHSAFLFLDIIGRISFPVFCFLLVEGYCHTSDKKRYFMRIWIAAVFSEIPYDLAFFGRCVDFRGQNVLFTMAAGIAVLSGMEKLKGNTRYLLLGAGMLLTWVLKVDYSFYGIVVISCFYLLRGMKKEMMSIQLCNQLVFACLSGGIQFASVLSLPVISCYNGTRGKNVKYAFYFFYPLHLFVLILIKFQMA